MQEIPQDAAKYIAHKCGLDIVIIYGRKEGHDGGECLTYAGTTYRYKRMADEMVRFLKEKVFGWSVDPETSLEPTAFDDIPKQDDGHGVGSKIILEGMDRRGRGPGRKFGK